ncbi:O-antigen ligase family protein [Vibrio sp. E150_018]
MTRVMIIGIIALLIKYHKHSWSIQRKTKQQIYTCLAMISFVAYLFGLQLYHGADKGLIRTIGLITIYYYLFPLHKFDQRWIIFALLINALGLGYLIYKNAYLLNINRLVIDAELMNPIPFATYCMVAAITQAYYAIKSQKVYLRYLCIIASIVSILGMLLTDTRGVALALFCIILLASFKIIKSKSRSFISLSIASITILTLLLGFILKDPLITRYNKTQYEIQQIEKGNLNTSIGIRFQIWNSGLHTFMDHPFLGIGNKNFRPEFKKHFEEGLIAKKIVSFNPMHYHNQFLDILVKNGIIGLFLFLSIFMVYILKQNKITIFSKTSFYIIAIFICSLTDVPFSHLSVIYFMILLLLFPSQTDKRI